MADWNTSTDDWGSGSKDNNDFGGDNGFGAADANAGGSFGMDRMASALDGAEGQLEDKPQHIPPMQKDPPKLEGWCQAKKYDYDAYTGAESAWDGSAKTYEWDGEHGEVGPEHPELEKMLFGEGKGPEDMGHGLDFSA